MRAAGLILLFSAVLAFSSDPFFGEDKAKHFLFSAVAAGTLTYIAVVNRNFQSGYPPAAAAGITLSLGLLKEIRDGFRRDNHFCFKDLFWDAAGAGAGLIPIGALARP